MITNEQDVGADFLVRELTERGVPVVRLNTERSPAWELTLRPTHGWRASRGQRVIESEQCVGVWWRRPEIPAGPAAAGAATEAVADQWRAFLGGLATIPGPVWVSEPARIRTAEDKASQLRRASSVDLAVPDTLWTNDLNAARAFVERWQDAAVVKSVATAWWEEAGDGRFVFASLITAGDLPALGRLASAPVCLQQPIAPKRDIRVTVIGATVLGAIRDRSPVSDEPLDWRQGDERPWSAYDLPVAIADACRDLVSGFGLRFSGIDLALDDNGQHWFLELNPNGEWGWLERAGLPIATALADTLLSRSS